MSIRLNLTGPTEEARAELARLQRSQRRTYLGASVRLWLLWAVVSVVLGAGLAAAVDRPSGEWLECWALLEAGDWDGAGCAGQWADLSERAEELWGLDGDPETGGLE